MGRVRRKAAMRARSTNLRVSQRRQQSTGPAQRPPRSSNWVNCVAAATRGRWGWGAGWNNWPFFILILRPWAMRPLRAFANLAINEYPPHPRHCLPPCGITTSLLGPPHSLFAPEKCFPLPHSVTFSGWRGWQVLAQIRYS